MILINRFIQKNNSTCIRYKKKFIGIATLIIFTCYCNLSYSLTAGRNEQLPSYDLIPITPQTWQKIELKYSDVINGKKYPAEIQLLRPIKWLKENGIDKIGNEVTLSIPEFGVVNVKATVTAINPTKLDTSNTNWSKMNSRPVIGTFNRYATDVRTYTFKDEKGNIETINATPNHPFYVKNKGAFTPIEDISSSDELVSQIGKEVRLVCSNNKVSHCGEKYNEHNNPVAVYNLEVYQKHVYQVGDNGILVHNNCNLKPLMEDDNLGNGRSYVYRLDTRDISDISKTGFVKWENSSFPDDVTYNGFRSISTTKLSDPKDFWNIKGVGGDILRDSEMAHVYKIDVTGLDRIYYARHSEATLRKAFGAGKYPADYLTSQEVHIFANITPNRISKYGTVFGNISNGGNVRMTDGRIINFKGDVDMSCLACMFDS